MMSPAEGWMLDRIDAALSAARLHLRIKIESASATLRAVETIRHLRPAEGGVKAASR